MAVEWDALRPRADDIEARILGRTWALFLEGDYAAITYEALARLERMSKQTIYRRFANKEALFDAAAERQVSLWPDQARAALAATARDPVATQVEETIKIFTTRSSAALRQIVARHDQKFPRLSALVRGQTTQAVARLSLLIQQTRAQTTPQEADIAARCVYDMLTGHVTGV